jgi:hypothetical protein
MLPGKFDEEGERRERRRNIRLKKSASTTLP